MAATKGENLAWGLTGGAKSSVLGGVAIRFMSLVDQSGGREGGEIAVYGVFGPENQPSISLTESVAVLP